MLGEGVGVGEYCFDRPWQSRSVEAKEVEGSGHCRRSALVVVAVVVEDCLWHRHRWHS